ncbi:septum formation initiator family protein, partial [Shimia thalassica]|uniref:septum formation initiator family protein n=1 Tax=Shimia thalassica TaxID=1715693 RepID=UPI0026E310B1
KSRPAFGVFEFFECAFALSSYFKFAAVHGEYGLFRRVEIEAEKATLEAELATFQIEVDRMENLTQRLSDSYLDLDL